MPGGNAGFLCRSCGARVSPLTNGSIRNHCPECLTSVHVDRVPGDRSEDCGGLMDAVGLAGSPTAGWTILFRCRRCGAERPNRAAEDDPAQPDRWDLLVELSTRAPGKPAGSRSTPRGRRR